MRFSAWRRQPVERAVLWRRDHRSELVSLATGLLLVVWVAIQTAVIGFRHWSQGIWWVTFSALTILAARLVRRRREA